MEVIYDSSVDIRPSLGTQCITHSHAEPCRIVQAASGTPAHINPQELTAVTKHDFGHPLDSAFIMQPSESEEGEASSSSTLTSTNSFSLKRNASTIGLIRHPVHVDSGDLRSPVWNGSTSGNSLESPQLSFSPRHVHSSVDAAHAVAGTLKNDWEFDADELTTTESALDRLMRAMHPASPDFNTPDLNSLNNAKASLWEGRSTHHVSEDDLTKRIASPSSALSKGFNSVAQGWNPNPSGTDMSFSQSPYDPIPLFRPSSQPSPLAPAAIIREGLQGKPANKVTFADRLGITRVRSDFSPDDSQTTTPKAASHEKPFQVVKLAEVLASSAVNCPQGSLSAEGREGQFDSLRKARFGEEFSRYPTFIGKGAGSKFPNRASTNPAGFSSHQLETAAKTQETAFVIPRARAQTDASDRSSRKERFFVPIPRPNVGKVIAKATKLVTSHSAGSIFASFTRPRAHSSPPLSSGDYGDAPLMIIGRKRLSSDGHGDSDWRPPTCWDIPDWQPQGSCLSPSESHLAYAGHGSDPTSSPELSPFLHTSSVRPYEEEDDDEVTSPLDEDAEATPKPGEHFRKRDENDPAYPLTQEEELRHLNYRPRRICLPGGEPVRRGMQYYTAPQWDNPAPSSTATESTPPPPIPPRHPSRSVRATSAQQPSSEADNDEIANDTSIEVPVFRNKIFAMFIAPPNPGDETNDASKVGATDAVLDESYCTHLHTVSSSPISAIATDQGSEGAIESKVIFSGIDVLPQVDDVPPSPSTVGLGIANVGEAIAAAQMEKINWCAAAAEVPGGASSNTVNGHSPASENAFASLHLSRGIKSKHSMPNLADCTASKADTRDPSQVIILKKGSPYKQASLSKSMTHLTAPFQLPTRSPPIPKHVPLPPRRPDLGDPQVLALIKATRAKAKECYLNKTPHLNRF